MEKYTDFTKFRTESDINLAKISLRHKIVLQEKTIAGTFQNFGEYFMNSLKLAFVQTGTSILSAVLIRVIQTRSK